MRGHLLYLDLLEAADTLMQALLYVALQDLLARSVLFNKLGRVLRAVEGQTERYFVGIADRIALQIAQFNIETTCFDAYKKFLSR